MKKWLILLILFATPALAETTVTFSWTPNTDSATGYNLYMDTGHGDPVMVIDGRDSAGCEFMIADDTKPHAFSLTAFNATQESEQSEYVVWQPAAPKPLTFTGSFKLVQETP